MKPLNYDGGGDGLLEWDDGGGGELGLLSRPRRASAAASDNCISVASATCCGES